AAEVRDDSEFSKRAVRPRILAQLLRQIQGFSPRLFGEHWIEILVGLPLYHAAPQPQTFIALNDRIVQVFRETLRHVRRWQALKLSAKSTDFRVQRVPTISLVAKDCCCLAIERRCAAPGFEPGQAIRLPNQRLRICAL